MLTSACIACEWLLLWSAFLPCWVWSISDYVAHPFTERSFRVPSSQVILASRSNPSHHSYSYNYRSRASHRDSSISSRGGGTGGDPRLPMYEFDESSTSSSSPSSHPVESHDDDAGDLNSMMPLHEDFFNEPSLHNDDGSPQQHSQRHTPKRMNYRHMYGNDAQHLQHSQQKQHDVLYRYYGKSTSRLRNRDSIPFIFLGPSVDHWKSVGQTLASRGFSVMACERNAHGSSHDSHHNDDANDDANSHVELVETILESLRWQRAILVGCDAEAVLAIRAALQLAPDRIAGLILCGDLSHVHESNIMKRMGPNPKQHSQLSYQNQHYYSSIDEFLQEHIECPYSVIWDGGTGGSTGGYYHRGNTATASVMTGDYQVQQHRCLIRGGGTAPHRRLPEQFAWALTRFVEEQVAPSSVQLVTTSSSSYDNYHGTEQQQAPHRRNRLRRFFMGNQFFFFTPGGMLVVGRVIAGAIFYLSAMKVVMYQYENIYEGMSRVQQGYRALSVWPKRLLHLTWKAIFARNSLRDLVVETRRKENGESFIATTTTPEDESLSSSTATALDETTSNTNEDVEIEEVSMDEQSEVEGLSESEQKAYDNDNNNDDYDFDIDDDHYFERWPLPLLNPVAV